MANKQYSPARLGKYRGIKKNYYLEFFNTLKKQILLFLYYRYKKVMLAHTGIENLLLDEQMIFLQDASGAKGLF